MEALGPILLVLSLPLVLRWVPKNYVFGFRVAPTLRDESVWYDANALAGRYFFLLGALMVALEFALPLTLRDTVLGILGGSGVVAITFIVWRAAYRWENERQNIPLPPPDPGGPGPGSCPPASSSIR